MTYLRKTWAEKFHNGKKPKVVINAKRYADVPAGALLLVPSPDIVDAYIRQIPFGATSNLAQMRKDLAASYHATVCCPVTTGIFIRVIAEKAYEEMLSGMSLERISPFWRIISITDPVAKKLSFGTAFIQQQRAKEGV